MVENRRRERIYKELTSLASDSYPPRRTRACLPQAGSTPDLATKVSVMRPFFVIYLMQQYLSQIALVVKDYDEAIDFYVNKLGFELVEDTF